MADVAAHEHEGIGFRACEAGNVANGMSGDVEDVEASVSEKVVGGKGADFVVAVEGDFVHGATFVVVVEDRAVLVCRVAWHKFLFESRPDV